MTAAEKGRRLASVFEKMARTAEECKNRGRIAAESAWHGLVENFFLRQSPLKTVSSVVFHPAFCRCSAALCRFSGPSPDSAGHRFYRCHMIGITCSSGLKVGTERGA